MTGEEIFRELGGIDSQLVLNAAPGVKVKRKSLFLRWASVAACFIVVFSLAFMFINKNNSEIQMPNLDSVIWFENVYMGEVDQNEYETFLESELTNVKSYEDIWLTDSLFNDILNSHEDDVFGILVIAREGNIDDVNNVKEMFLNNGIFACVVDERIIIFPTKSHLSNLKMSEEEKGMLVFTYASRSFFKK